jgi:hypothetical protein
MSCALLDLGCHVDGGIQSLVSIVPFGASGAIFLAGMVAGAALGRWGVAAVIVAAGALKYADREHEQLKPGSPDAAPPVPKPRKPTILNRH